MRTKSLTIGQSFQQLGKVTSQSRCCFPIKLGFVDFRMPQLSKTFTMSTGPLSAWPTRRHFGSPEHSPDTTRSRWALWRQHCSSVRKARTIRQFVSEELHQGLGLDIFIGLPESESARVSDLKAPTEMRSVDNAQEHTPAQIAALANPPLEPTVANEPDWRSAEIPSANGHATARSLAQLYSALASNGEINGRSVAKKTTISKAISAQMEGIDAVLSIEARWGCGFLLNTSGLYGPNPHTFGHSGWGGSFAFGDPSTGIGVAYTMNQMGTDLVGDPRNMALIEAVYGSIGV